MWGQQSTFTNVELQLLLPDPDSGCKIYSGGLPTVPSAFLVNGLNKCPLSNLIHNAQSKAAQALFIVNHDDSDINSIPLPDQLTGTLLRLTQASRYTYSSSAIQTAK